MVAHTEHKYSPFELVYGRQFQFPTNLTNKIDPVYNTDSCVTEMKYRIQTASAKAKALLNKSKITRIKSQSQTSNPLDTKVGDTVWLKVDDKKFKKLSVKSLIS